MRILRNAYSRLVNLIEDIDKISFAYDSPIERCLLLPNYFGLCCWRCNTRWISFLWSVAAHTLRAVSHTRAESVRFEEKRSNRKSKTKSKSVRAAWERSINIDRRMIRLAIRLLVMLYFIDCFLLDMKTTCYCAEIGSCGTLLRMNHIMDDLQNVHRIFCRVYRIFCSYSIRSK